MRRVEYHDQGPDRLGRRFYTLYWTEPNGVFRPEPSNEDGKPVGYRRGQVFRTKPPGPEVVEWNGKGSPWAGMPQ